MIARHNHAYRNGYYIKAHIPIAYHLPLARGFALVAIILFAASTLAFQPRPETDWLIPAFVLMVAGAVVLGLSLFLYPRPGTHHTTVSTPQKRLFPRRANIPLTLAGMACFVVLIGINSDGFGIPALQTASIHLQFVLLMAGLILTTWGLAGGRVPLPDVRRLRSRARATPVLTLDDTQPASVRANHTHHLLLALILIVAFAVRLWDLGTAVHHFIDEVHFTTAVMTLRLGADTTKLLAPFSGITAFPWLTPYLQAGGVAVLGRNLEGLRLMSVFAGTLGVAAVYLLGRALFDRKTALLAALLLATFPPHVQFSRIGLNNIVDPLFGTLALAFLVRGLKSNRRAEFAMSGAALGLTQYFYEGGRLLYPALMLLTLAWYALTRVRFPVEQGQVVVYLRQRARGLLVMAAGAFIIGLPVYTTLVAIGEPLNSRFQTVGIGGSYWIRVMERGRPQTVEQHLFVPFLVYTYQPEIALYYGGELGLVLPYLVPFLMLGFFALAYRPRAPGFMLVLWFLLTSAGNMLMTEAAVYARYVVGFPAVALLIAVGIQTSVALLWPKRSRLLTVLLAALCIVMAAEQVRYYFGPHLTRYNQQLRQRYDSEDAMFRSATFPWGTQIHVLTRSLPSPVYLSGVLSYLADGLNVFVLSPDDLTAGYLTGLARGVDQAFFVEQGDPQTVELLKQHFDLEGPFNSPYNIPWESQLLLYYARYGGAPLG